MGKEQEPQCSGLVVLDIESCSHKAGVVETTWYPFLSIERWRKCTVTTFKITCKREAYVDVVYYNILRATTEYTMDGEGHVVFEDLLDKCSDKQRVFLLVEAVEDPDIFLLLSCHRYGYVLSSTIIHAAEYNFVMNLWCCILYRVNRMLYYLMN